MINSYVYLLVLFIVFFITPFIYSILMTESISLGYRICKLSLKLFSPIGKKIRREAVRDMLVAKADDFINQISSGKSSELISQGFDEEFVKKVKALSGEQKKELVQNHVDYEYVDTFLGSIHEKTPLGFFLGRTRVFSDKKNKEAYFKNMQREKSIDNSKLKSKADVRRMIIKKQQQKVLNKQRKNSDIYAGSYEKLINKFTKTKFSVII